MKSTFFEHLPHVENSQTLESNPDRLLQSHRMADAGVSDEDHKEFLKRYWYDKAGTEKFNAVGIVHAGNPSGQAEMHRQKSNWWRDVQTAIDDANTRKLREEQKQHQDAMLIEQKNANRLFLWYVGLVAITLFVLAGSLAVAIVALNNGGA